jgi:hypothetical protein
MCLAWFPFLSANYPNSYDFSKLFNTERSVSLHPLLLGRSALMRLTCSICAYEPSKRGRRIGTSTHLSIEMSSALSPNPIVIKLPSVFLANICVHRRTAQPLSCRIPARLKKRSPEVILNPRDAARSAISSIFVLSSIRKGSVNSRCLASKACSGERPVRNSISSGRKLPKPFIPTTQYGVN